MTMGIYETKHSYICKVYEIKQFGVEEQVAVGKVVRTIGI
jgi:hypothetical protein